MVNAKTPNKTSAKTPAKTPTKTPTKTPAKTPAKTLTKKAKVQATSAKKDATTKAVELPLDFDPKTYVSKAKLAESLSVVMMLRDLYASAKQSSEKKELFETDTSLVNLQVELKKIPLLHRPFLALNHGALVDHQVDDQRELGDGRNADGEVLLVAAVEEHSEEVAGSDALIGHHLLPIIF